MKNLIGTHARRIISFVRGLKEQALPPGVLQVAAKLVADFAAVGSRKRGQGLSRRGISVSKMILTAQEDGDRN